MIYSRLQWSMCLLNLNAQITEVILIINECNICVTFKIMYHGSVYSIPHCIVFPRNYFNNNI